MTSSSTLLLQREEVTVDLVELIGTRFPGMGMLYIWGNFSCSQLLFVIFFKKFISYPSEKVQYENENAIIGNLVIGRASGNDLKQIPGSPEYCSLVFAL